MIIRNINEVPAIPYGTGARKRVMIGPKEGAPTFVMRVFDVPPGGASNDHSHDFEHEVLILQGDATCKGDGPDQHVSEGAAYFIPPNERHQIVNTGKGNLRFVCLVPLRGEDSVESACFYDPAAKK
jgi:quercetin dioxygenase-like cupin family protein